MNKKLLTVREIAPILRVDPETIRRYCRTNKIEFIRVGHAYLFDVENLQKIK